MTRVRFGESPAIATVGLFLLIVAMAAALWASEPC